jgi:hypothetical protein
MAKVKDPEGDEVIDPAENNDRELVQDFCVFAVAAKKQL